jgi:hypothetical protein
LRLTSAIIPSRVSRWNQEVESMELHSNNA